MKKILCLMALLLCGCVGRPDNIYPVGQFDTSRYLGKWYEIARLDHSFEKGLSKVTAEYSLRSDGGLKVVNRGYQAADSVWKESIGKAYFVDKLDEGYLKVSFFGPFYGSYIVFDLEPHDYRYSMVSGPDKSYFWLLSRTPTMDPATQKRLLDKARALGFDTAKLIYPQHD
ncbi:lipocalin family protein [Janthinobacterium agaricidamnosum]|uniref:Outer membrane lipoprotein Blc n=1 Tax=Janthinobacterium agaricidamnosum NBRC 102515 = DSM 9628 TaxID=1349767 RepID=W0V821_9BURK|nr:lipocalin family protein [Janthinobacterium agaricidamnosum]CDG84026.1 lipocalin-like domain protein [Janthinobacterium agaricidamnosum NBRC 102515 = DSM 9628]